MATVWVDGVELPVSDLLGPRAELVYRTLSSVLHLPGDVAECGIYEGVTTVGLARLAGPDKRVHAFDGFAGLGPIGTEERRLAVGDGLCVGAYAGDLPATRARLGEASNVELYVGSFEDELPRFDAPLCFIHSDSDLMDSTRLTIELAERTLVPGGAVVFDDVGNPRFPGVQLAVERWLDRECFVGSRVPGTIQYVARRR